MAVRAAQAGWARRGTRRRRVPSAASDRLAVDVDWLDRVVGPGSDGSDGSDGEGWVPALELDTLLAQLNGRAEALRTPANGAESAHGQASPAIAERSIGSVPPPTPARAGVGSLMNEWSMRLRGVLLDPGKRGAKAMACAALLAVLATAVWVVIDAPAGGVEPLEHAEPVPTAEASVVAGATMSASTASAPAEFVVVHVAGLVAAPGVYQLPGGARVVDALTAAGGALPGADLSTVNLARVVADGEQIAIGVPAAAHSGAGAAPQNGAPASGGPASGLMNLNTATVEQLDQLPGIGPVLAQNIVTWRQNNGRFIAVDQLREVSGIGESKFAQLEGLVTV